MPNASALTYAGALMSLLRAKDMCQRSKLFQLTLGYEVSKGLDLCRHCLWKRTVLDSPLIHGTY